MGFAQLAAADALEGPQDIVSHFRDSYKRRRDIALGILRDNGLYQYTPEGGFYILVDISSTGMASRDFAIRLLSDRHVAVAPGSTFGPGAASAVRVSIAASDDDVRKGMTHLCEFIRECAAVHAAKQQS